MRIFGYLLLCAVGAIAMSSNYHAIAADDIIVKLGEPRRNVIFGAPRPVEIIARRLASGDPADTGVFPVMIFPSRSAIVEAVFNMIPSAAKCRTVLADYHRRLRAQHGDKIRERLYCVSIVQGKLKSIDTVAESF